MGLKMKRKALLIGNTGGLEGVKLDIENMRAFLLSHTGGAWYNSEIDVLINPRLTEIQSKLNQIKSASPDYFITLFSGHGAHARQTVLEINPSGEMISESFFNDVTERQLSIFDCCRKQLAMTSVSKSVISLASNFLRESLDVIREKYDSRIMQAIPQHVKLYSCKIDEYSYDTDKGAIYLSSLLEAACSNSFSNDFLTVEKAHSDASLKTIDKVKKDPECKTSQTPVGSFPKCISFQQLIISLK